MIAVYPTKEQIGGLLAGPQEQPVVMLSLLRFKDEVAAARYLAEYGTPAREVITAVGGRPMWAGRAEQVLVDTSHSGWDLAVLVWYPDRKTYLAFLEHPQVEAGPVVGDQQRRDPRVVHADADPVAGDPRLGDLEQRGADPVAVADADLVVGEPLDREVLAELPVHEVVAPELALPVAVRRDLVDEDRSMLAAVRPLRPITRPRSPAPTRTSRRCLPSVSTSSTTTDSGWSTIDLTMCVRTATAVGAELTCWP